jgi:DDE domain
MLLIVCPYCRCRETHEAEREWEERFAPLLPKQLRRKRSGKVGGRWYVNETYLKVKGNGGYLYRAIDRSGRSGGLKVRFPSQAATAIYYPSASAPSQFRRSLSNTPSSLVLFLRTGASVPPVLTLSNRKGARKPKGE